MYNLNVVPNNRIQWVDSVKGIATLFVMISHIYLVPIPSFRYMYYGYMAVFYIMSGYTSKPVSSFKSMLVQKSQRLLTPYFFYGMLGIWIGLCTFNHFNLKGSIVGLLYGRWAISVDITASDAILMLGNCKTIAPLWFLPSLFVSYIIIYLYDTSDKYKKEILILLLLLSMVSVYKPILLPWSTDTATIATLFILMGRRFHTLLNHFEHRNKFYLTAAIIISTIIYYWLCRYNGYPNFSIGFFGHRGFFSVIVYIVLGVVETLLMCFFCILIDKTIAGTIFSYVGRHSLRLICTHWIIAEFVVFCFPAQSFLTSLTITPFAIFLIDALLECCFKRCASQYKLLAFL